MAEKSDKTIQHTMIGSVLSDKRDKTLTVEVVRQFRHPMYGKYIRRKSKFHVHDENNQGRVGNIVRIAPGRMMSKTKSWHLVDIVEQGEGAE